MSGQVRPLENLLNEADRCGSLTVREQQIATLVCGGLSNKQIARNLNVSEGTIKCHLHAVYTKLRLQSRYELLIALYRPRSD
jgi:two-component system, NarL family, nitrate/nitrite response regulator NarL